MINEVTFSPIKQTIAFGEKACINGVIINTNNMPLTIQLTDWNYLTNQITILPHSKMSFKDLKIRQMKAITGQGVLIYSPDGQSIDVGIENVSVKNIDNLLQHQDYFFSHSTTGHFPGSLFLSPSLMGFTIDLPPQTGIKIKNFNVQASPTFSPFIAITKPPLWILADADTYVEPYTGHPLSFLLKSINENKQFCSQLKGNNSYIFIENGNGFLYLSSYSASSVICGDSSSKKTLSLSLNDINFSTFNYTSNTMTIFMLFGDNFSGRYTFTANWYVSMLVEAIPPDKTPQINKYLVFHTVSPFDLRLGI